jgi:hypothetical protein
VECCVAVTARFASRRLGLLLAALLLIRGQFVFAADRLVLIASANSPVLELNSLEIQKLFLGLTVFVGGKELHPLRNESDDFMRQIFYQDIISMSETTYERRLLALTLQQGRTAPPLYHDTKALLSAVAADPNAVSFAWAAAVGGDARIKVLRVLGHE